MTNQATALPARKSLLSRPLGFLSHAAVYGCLTPAMIALNTLVGVILPRLMTPVQFGEYSLVVTLFQYGLIFDLGASQLIDRVVPKYLGSGNPGQAEHAGMELLWLRVYVAVATYAMMAIAISVGVLTGIAPFTLESALLSALAGVLFMVAAGPACIYRAHSARRNYAISQAILSCALVIARPAGLILGGLNGCFGALVAWYIACGVIFHVRLPPRRRDRPSLARAITLLASGIPLFTAGFMWAFYVTASRWFVSGLLPPEEFGNFAFGTNIMALIVGAASSFSAFYYPQMTQRITSNPLGALSRTLTLDLERLVLGTFILVSVGIVLAPWLIAIVYPAYTPAVRTVQIILIAVPSLTLSSWLLPISLSGGRRPWVDGTVVFPLATAILGIAVYAWGTASGVTGAASASVPGAIVLLAMQIVVLRSSSILKSRDAVELFVLLLIGTGLLIELTQMVR